MELLLYTLLSFIVLTIVGLSLAYLGASVYLLFKPSKTAASIQLFVILTVQTVLPYLRN